MIWYYRSCLWVSASGFGFAAGNCVRNLVTADWTWAAAMAATMGTNGYAWRYFLRQCRQLRQVTA